MICPQASSPSLGESWGGCLIMICPQARAPSLGEGWGGCLSLGEAGAAFGTSLLDLLYHPIGIVEAEFASLTKVFEPFGLLL